MTYVLDAFQIISTELQEILIINITKTNTKLFNSWLYLSQLFTIILWRFFISSSRAKVTTTQLCMFISKGT